MKAVCCALEGERLRATPTPASTTTIDRHQHPGDQRRRGPKKAGRQEGEHRQARRTGHQRREHDRQQARPPFFDDARAQHGRHIAAEAQEQRHERLAVQAHQVHEAVHDIGRPRQVAHVLQQCPSTAKKMTRIGRKVKHRADAADQAVDQQAGNPGRRRQASSARQAYADRRQEHYCCSQSAKGAAIGRSARRPGPAWPAAASKPPIGWVATRSSRSVSEIAPAAAG